MEDIIIESITYIKSISKKKPFIDRIKTHIFKFGDENNVWLIENQPNILLDMCDKSWLIILTKSKKTLERKLAEETLAELTSQCTPFSESYSLVTPEPKNIRNHCSYKKA